MNYLYRMINHRARCVASQEYEAQRGNMVVYRGDMAGALNNYNRHFKNFNRHGEFPIFKQLAQAAEVHVAVTLLSRDWIFSGINWLTYSLLIDPRIIALKTYTETEQHTALMALYSSYKDHMGSEYVRGGGPYYQLPPVDAKEALTRIREEYEEPYYHTWENLQARNKLLASESEKLNYRENSKTRQLIDSLVEAQKNEGYGRHEHAVHVANAIVLSFAEQMAEDRASLGAQILLKRAEAMETPEYRALVALDSQMAPEVWIDSAPGVVPFNY